MLLGAGMEPGSKQQAPVAATSAGVSPVQEGMGNPGQKLLRNRLCNASVSKSLLIKIGTRGDKFTKCWICVFTFRLFLAFGVPPHSLLAVSICACSLGFGQYMEMENTS